MANNSSFSTPWGDWELKLCRRKVCFSDRMSSSMFHRRPDDSSSLVNRYNSTRMVKILERVNGQSPMMDSGYDGQEELASVAGLRDEVPSTKSCSCGMSTWRPRITFSNLRSKDDCGCPMARGRPWPGLPSVWGGKPYRKSLASPKPDTILAWYRKLVAQKFDGSKKRGLS